MDLLPYAGCGGGRGHDVVVRSCANILIAILTAVTSAALCALLEL